MIRTSSTGMSARSSRWTRKTISATVTARDKSSHVSGVRPEAQRRDRQEYDFADMDQLAHAFSLTIHKSQGSEYPACVIVLHTQHYMMLARNLVYTALTRAKKIAVFIGSRRAIQMAVRNKRAVPRYTRLAQRLQRLVDDLGPDGRRKTAPGTTPKKDTPPPALPGRLL